MQISKVNFQGIKTDTPKTPKEKKSCNGIGYALSATLPAVLGLTHGIYKKFEKTEYIVHPQAPQGFNPAANNKLLIKLALMMEKNGSENAISIASEIPHHRRFHLISKVLLDDFVNLEEISHHNIASRFIEILTKMGFNPKTEKLMDFIEKHDIEKLNEKIKNITGIDFHIQFESGKGRGKTIYRVVDILEQEKEQRLTPPPQPPKGDVKIFAFQKILNPYDEKFLSKIEKLPLCKKFADYMRKTNSPIKRITFKPLRHLFYDTTSMGKGAGAAAIGGLAIYSTAKAACYALNKRKEEPISDK